MWSGRLYKSRPTGLFELNLFGDKDYICREDYDHIRNAWTRYDHSRMDFVREELMPYYKEFLYNCITKAIENRSENLLLCISFYIYEKEFDMSPIEIIKIGKFLHRMIGHCTQIISHSISILDGQILLIANIANPHIAHYRNIQKMDADSKKNVSRSWKILAISVAINLLFFILPFCMRAWFQKESSYGRFR